MALFTDDIRRGMLIAEALRSGMVVINDSTNWFEYLVVELEPKAVLGAWAGDLATTDSRN